MRVYAASPIDCSRSNAYSRMVDSIVNRGSAYSPSIARTRLLSMSDDTPSKASSPRSWRASHTASAPSSVHPLTKTERRRKSRFGRREQFVAPIDSRPQRLLPRRPVARAAVERQALPGHARQERLGRNHLDPRRGQLDGERQPVERQADIGNRARVLVGQGKPGARGPGALYEQPHGRDVGHRRRPADARRAESPEGTRGTRARR